MSENSALRRKTQCLVMSEKTGEEGGLGVGGGCKRWGTNAQGLVMTRESKVPRANRYGDMRIADLVLYPSI